MCCRVPFRRTSIAAPGHVRDHGSKKLVMNGSFMNSEATLAWEEAGGMIF